MGKSVIIPDGLIELGKRTKGQNYLKGIQQGLLLYSLVMIEQPKVVVEIGSQTGFSTCFLAMAMADNEYKDKAGHVYGIEKMLPHVKTSRRNIENFGLSEFATIFHGDSKDAIWSHKELHQIGFMFIDGDHSYDKVYSDIADNIQFVGENALVLFHDYSAETRRGVDDALDDLELKGHGFQRITLRILTNGLLIRKVK